MLNGRKTDGLRLLTHGIPPRFDRDFSRRSSLPAATSPHPQKPPGGGVEPFEPSFSDPYHFTQLHAGFFVGRYDIGLDDDHHVGLQANIGDRSGRTAPGPE